MRAGIALGSNLGDRLANLRAGRNRVLEIAGVSGPLLSSRVYETDPVDTAPNSGPFLNAVIEIEFIGQPIDLLEGLQHIESALGRPSKRPRNSPRTLDLDILYAGNLVLSNEEVVIPHPRLHQRRFVLSPLSDIRPDLVLPGQEKSVIQLLTALTDPATVSPWAETL
ncbi:MAG TPA: 2-amino-4-hydroxy-6-hydroxymethyldihydropteridine diphosphokinase [Chthoniobacteraceae bacterium]|nr:2-amino-4-hydroxy-6-hydroxymethyldihydropteridine diphosphokinase [Chthoniobacteraceae bacterium]